MAGWEVIFGRPWFLCLLALIPVLWFVSFRSLAGLGKIRRNVALCLRSLVVVGIVLALAEIQVRQSSERVTVIYLLDQSESIPAPKRQSMLDYVVREVASHRNAERGDKAGVIVFGRDAMIEIPPFADDLPSVGQIESSREMRPDGTNLAAALKLAQASFPEDSAKRIVLVSDGNENIGNARAVAPMLAEQGIGLDVAPIEIGGRGEVAVEKVVLPSNTRRGQPLETRVVLENFGDEQVAGKLTLTRRLGAAESLLNETAVVLKPGPNVFSVREPEIESSGIFTYAATFTPDDKSQDRLIENNKATGFTHVRGKGRVLLIEDWEHPGEFDFLVDRLRMNEIEVDVMPSNQLFTSLAELQAFDAVILANVPRSSGSDANNVSNFSDEQITMLVQNTEHMGCGLILLGGPNSFGAGGWANTDLEKAVPVDFQIKNAKVNAVGALAMVMHASELAQGNYWQKVIGIEALKALGPMDYCGMIHWSNSGGEEWLWGQPMGMLEVGPNRRVMLSSMTRMTPGDMPAFDPAMRMALTSLKSTNAAMKHMIMISDGDPSQPAPTLLQSFKDASIKISTVAVGAHGTVGHQTLQNIATVTGGNYYVATNPKALPRIFQREARRVARPLVLEPDGGMVPQVVADHQVHGLTGEQLPLIRGMVLTTVKSNPLVEVSIRSPIPESEANSTILASWTYGIGRSVVFTTDAGQRWTSTWTSWPNYDKFFTQMVRWAMRPADTGGKFAVATEYREGKVRVVVNALDKEDRFLNLDELTGTALGPDLQPFPVRIEQVAPGRYVGEFAVDAPGNVYLTINTGTEEVDNNGVKERRSRPPLISGVSVPYSSEFNDRITNKALLESLARLRPKGGESGQVAGEDVRPETMDGLLRQFNSFRHTLAKAVSIEDIWPWVLAVVAGTFFFDVFVRRVTIGLEWVAPLVQAVRRRLFGAETDTAETDERLERLRSRKAAVTGEIDERRAAARFAPELDDARAAEALEQASGGAAASGPAESRPTQAPGLSPGAAETSEDSYTARLLKAKHRAQDQARPRE